MFENGILATFIPEILMVIGFILCLFTPGFRSHNSTVEQASIMAQVSSYEHQPASTYHVSSYDFTTTAEVVPDIHYSLHCFSKVVIISNIESSFSTSDGLSYVSFSRPPPSFLF